MPLRLYRTQEVAGSSPASSIQEVPADGAIRPHRGIGARQLIYLRATEPSQNFRFGRDRNGSVRALTHGDASAKAVKAATHKIHSA